MAVELSYVVITPHSIVKSRTGGIIARILSRTDLELVSAQIFAPDESFVNEYMESLKNPALYAISSEQSELFQDYVRENFMPSEGRKHRAMLLLFQGEDAISKIFKICGPMSETGFTDHEKTAGETVRDTYADLIWADKEKRIVKYFEPAVVFARSVESIKYTLNMFSKFLRNQENIVENITYENPEIIERTLVIIKPDNWNYASSRPGSIIDMFSRTGLRIIGCKMFRMSVSQALEFYEPVKDVLVEKHSANFGEKACKILEKEFSMTLSDISKQYLTDGFGKNYANEQFEKIIEFMSGIRPDQCPKEYITEPGKVKSMVLIYEGEHAVQKIRKVLGPTDPTKAPGGTIRKEFGHSVMINSAHASDSVENAKREMNIVRINENTLTLHIDEYLKQ
ncbi:MAG: nucleoside-diphosphate kinase [Spirochaetales bacterium]